MSDIRDKIAKLLALSKSTSEKEAQAALLKARQLMAEHKLQMEDICMREKKRVIVERIGVTCTTMTDPWAVPLSAIIAEHYCCKAHTVRRPGTRTAEIGFAGMEDDFAVCKQAFLYACDCVKSRCREIRGEHQKMGYPAKDIREMCNAYGFGFNSGLQAAFSQQKAQHQWGLVMTVPQEVLDATAHHKKGKAFGRANFSGWRSSYAAAGFKDGSDFGTIRRIEPTDVSASAKEKGA